MLHECYMYTFFIHAHFNIDIMSYFFSSLTMKNEIMIKIFIKKQNIFENYYFFIWWICLVWDYQYFGHFNPQPIFFFLFVTTKVNIEIINILLNVQAIIFHIQSRSIHVLIHNLSLGALPQTYRLHTKIRNTI